MDYRILNRIPAAYLVMKRSRLTDEQLVHNFQNSNSADDFELLYNRYSVKIYQVCLSITKDSEDAQDYTQDIFIKVFGKLDSFQNRSKFLTWLYSVAHHYCFDQLRLNKRINTESLSDELTDIVSEATLTDSAEWRMQVLETVLHELPAEEINLLRLKYEHGLSIREISQQYNLSESAVKMRLKRTRDALQQRYASRIY